MEEEKSGLQPLVINQSEAIRSPHYAGLLMRAIAGIIDGIIMVIIGAIPLAIIVYMSASIAYGNRSLFYPAAIVIVLVAIVISWLYEAGFESSKYMATPGKMICGLKVTSREGRRITFGTATIRFIFKSAIPSLLQSFINNCLSGIYLLADVLIMYTNEKRQCLHDMAAGTVVVHNE